MSQQEAFMTEDEVRQYINESLGLKLDKRSLLEPTADFVIDLYSKFLDDINPKWKKPPGNEELDDIEGVICHEISEIVSLYPAIRIRFQLSDVLMPTKKRFIMFLNVLIYVREQLDKYKTEWQVGVDDYMFHQKKVEEAKRELNTWTRKNEEIIIANAGSPSNEELVQMLRNVQLELKEVKEESDEFTRKKEILKEEMKQEEESQLEQQVELDKLKKDLRESEELLYQLDNGELIKDDIRNLEQQISRKNKENDALELEIRKIEEQTRKLEPTTNEEHWKALDWFKKFSEDIVSKTESVEEEISSLSIKKDHLKAEESELETRLEEMKSLVSSAKLRLKTKEDKMRAELDQIRNQRELLKEEYTEAVAQVAKESQNIKRELNQLKKSESDMKTNCETLVEKAKHLHENLCKKYGTSDYLKSSTFEQAIKCRIKILNLIGIANEIPTPDIPADRTYIVQK